MILSKPKTESSTRNIPLPFFLSKLLYNFKSKDEYFILSNSLKPKDPRSVEKYFSSITQKCKINKLSFHALRHTYATRLREKNVDIKVISELLGHSDWRITQDIYIHTSNDIKRNSVELIAKMFN